MVDVENPYRAPEAEIARLAEELHRPSVYTAISIFSWIAGGCCFLALGSFAVVLLWDGSQFGWKRHLEWLGNLRVMLMLASAALGTLAYLVAGRLLWVNRGLPGLSLCSAAIGLTYLAIWLMTWK